MKKEIIISGFGGQGVMSIGKNIAEAGTEEEMEVTWVPSYGPEMRGGTANCTVILSDQRIGAPIAEHPSELIAMGRSLLSFFMNYSYSKYILPLSSLFSDIRLIPA